MGEFECLQAETEVKKIYWFRSCTAGLFVRGNLSKTLKKLNILFLGF